MLRTRVIPCLLLQNKGLVKSVRFKEFKYVGDPINAVRIFNDKEVDELIFLDIGATRDQRRISFELVSQIASECFMPLCVGGGIRTVDDIRTLFSLGVEKVSINTSAVENPSLVKEAAESFGSQSIIISIDVQRKLLGRYEVHSHSGTRPTGLDPVEHAVEMERLGAGEILINSINRDGTMMGYDVELISMVSNAVNIPVIACGGAGKPKDFVSAVKAGASAVAAGSMFVFYGPHRAVLINYPSQQELEQILQEDLAN